MMKRFLSGALAAAVVLSSAAVVAPANADAAVKVPKAAYSFDMNKANKNVVAVARKGDTTNYTNTDMMPTEAVAKSQKIKLKYAKGHNGKALYLDRSKSYGAQLKGVKLGTGSWSVSFWVKAASSLNDYMPVFFTASSVKEKNANWVSVTKASWLGNASPTIWSRNAKKNEFPWFSNNEWAENNAIEPNKWVHVVLTVNAKKTCEYGTAGEEGYVKGMWGKTYVNGVYYGNGAVANGSMTNSNKFFLGINGWDTPFKGYFDDVKLWKKALTAKQAKALYKSEK